MVKKKLTVSEESQDQVFSSEEGKRAECLVGQRMWAQPLNAVNPA